MQQLIKNRMLILLLLVLLVIKFIWVPLWDEKQQAWQRIVALEKSAAKSQSLIEQESKIQERSGIIESMLDSIELFIPTTQNMSGLKLQQQQKVEALISSHSLTITQISWNDGLLEQGIQPIYLDIRLSGEVNKLIEFMISLEQSTDFNVYGLESLRMNFNGQSDDKMGNFRGSLMLVLPVRGQDGG